MHGQEALRQLTEHNVLQAQAAFYKGAALYLFKPASIPGIYDIILKHIIDSTNFQFSFSLLSDSPDSINIKTMTKVVGPACRN
jgi:hypothetical protein